jgi:hypothetical protein
MPTGLGIIGHLLGSRIFNAVVAEFCEKCRDPVLDLQSALEQQRLDPADQQ